MDVIILQDKCNYSKPPFSLYEGLKEKGVKVIESELSHETILSSWQSELGDKRIDFIVDNWSKDTASAEPIINFAKEMKASQYLFISSAGIYKSSGVMPLLETDAVKDTDIRAVEKILEASTIPYTIFRPQYIYGPNANKRYLDFFIGRAVRKLPIPLPNHGDQLVCVTHIEDVCSLISTAIGNSKAINQVFNCGSDRYISYRGLADLCHKSLGHDAKEAQYLFYNPSDFNTWTDKSTISQIPFRPQSFIISPSKAKVHLNWSVKHDITLDILSEIETYKATKGTGNTWGLSELRCDMEIVASKDIEFMFTYPFFDEYTVDPYERPYFFESS